MVSHIYALTPSTLSPPLTLALSAYDRKAIGPRGLASETRRVWVEKVSSRATFLNMWFVFHTTRPIPPSRHFNFPSEP